MKMAAITSLTLRAFRAKLAEILLYSEAPVVVAKDRVPLGIFLPIKVWDGRGASDGDRRAIQWALDRSGIDEGQVRHCLDDYATRTRRGTRMDGPRRPAGGEDA